MATVIALTLGYGTGDMNDPRGVYGAELRSRPAFLATILDAMKGRMPELSAAQPGSRNLLTDVEDISVGNAEDHRVLSGVTVVLPATPAAGAVEQRGGAPGTRETDALDPAGFVEDIHAIVLAGGSVFGLDAAGSVTSRLAARGVGFRYGMQPIPCPIVPAAILFDLMNGGTKDFVDDPPYGELGRQALAAAGKNFALGNSGAGLGAIAGRVKGGLGSASIVWEGFTVGALVAVNSFGSPFNPRDGVLWSEPFRIGSEFGQAAGHARDPSSDPVWAATKREAAMVAAGQNTTIGVVATDASLSKTELRRLAIMAADGLARAIRPVHSPFDGDTVFALSTRRRPLTEPRPLTLGAIGTLAADTLARAVGRAIWEAQPVAGWPAYRHSKGA